MDRKILVQECIAKIAKQKKSLMLGFGKFLGFDIVSLDFWVKRLIPRDTNLCLGAQALNVHRLGVIRGRVCGFGYCLW